MPLIRHNPGRRTVERMVRAAVRQGDRLGAAPRDEQAAAWQVNERLRPMVPTIILEACGQTVRREGLIENPPSYFASNQLISVYIDGRSFRQVTEADRPDWRCRLEIVPEDGPCTILWLQEAIVGEFTESVVDRIIEDMTSICGPLPDDVRHCLMTKLGVLD